jgi:hypothetical protein
VEKPWVLPGLMVNVPALQLAELEHGVSWSVLERLVPVSVKDTATVSSLAEQLVTL